MTMKVRGEEVPLLLTGAAEQVDVPVTSPFDDEEGLGLR